MAQRSGHSSDPTTPMLLAVLFNGVLREASLPSEARVILVLATLVVLVILHHR